MPADSSGPAPSSQASLLLVEEIRSDAWSRDHPHRSLTVVRTRNCVEWVRAVCARLGGKVFVVVVEALTY